MASVTNLNALIAAAKSGGVVTWDGDLEDILNEISTLIKDRGILLYATSADLVGVGSDEGYFAIVEDGGLWRYTYSATAPTEPYVAADVADYYWVMVANYDNVQLSLSALTDVNIAGETNGQTIAFNSSNSKWENADLAPMAIVTPTNGQTLYYDDTVAKFVNRSVSVISSGAPTTINLTNNDDILLITDKNANYVVNLPYPTYDGKEIDIAYSVQPNGSGNVEVDANGIAIFNLDGNGSYGFTDAKFAATFKYDESTLNYVVISSR